MSEKQAKAERRLAREASLSATRAQRYLTIGRFVQFYNTLLPEDAQADITKLVEQFSTDVICIIEQHGGDFLRAAGLNRADHIQNHEPKDAGDANVH